MKKIAVINITSFGREFPEHITELEKNVGKVEKMAISANVEGEELAKRLEGFSYILLGNYPVFNEEFFAANKSVKLISRHGIGYNNVDVNAAEKYGVQVTRINNEVENDAVAEQAVALLMSVSKNILKANEKTHLGEWNINRQEIMGYQIRKNVVGVIGCGSIGKRFAEIMHYGFKNKILIYDPYLKKEDVAFECEICDLNSLLERSDFISLHCLLNEETRHIIAKEQLDKMRKDSILINTARGELVNEIELYNALKEKKIFAYGADVAALEPMDKNHPLLQLNNVLITPHSAIYNRTCMYNMNRKVMKDIYDIEEGKEPFMLVNKGENYE